MSENSVKGPPFDLHVLSTPPAFILSQDQTLNKMVSVQAIQLVQIILLKLFQASKKFRLGPFPISRLKRTLSSSGASCFFFTLFNLQGTHRFAVGSRLYHTALSLSSTFFRNFSSPLLSCSLAPRTNFYMLPHLQALVKCFFQIFFGLAQPSG